MNLASVLVLLVVFALVAAVIGKAIWNRKNNKSSSCGCDCSGCAGCGMCHPDQK